MDAIFSKTFKREVELYKDEKSNFSNTPNESCAALNIGQQKIQLMSSCVNIRLCRPPLVLVEVRCRASREASRSPWCCPAPPAASCSCDVKNRNSDGSEQGLMYRRMWLIHKPMWSIHKRTWPIHKRRWLV